MANNQKEKINPFLAESPPTHTQIFKEHVRALNSEYYSKGQGCLSKEMMTQCSQSLLALLNNNTLQTTAFT